MAGGKRIFDKHNEQALFAVSASTIKVGKTTASWTSYSKMLQGYLQIVVTPVLY